MMLLQVLCTLQYFSLHVSAQLNPRSHRGLYRGWQSGHPQGAAAGTLYITLFYCECFFPGKSQATV